MTYRTETWVNNVDEIAKKANALSSGTRIIAMVPIGSSNSAVNVLMHVKQQNRPHPKTEIAADPDGLNWADDLTNVKRLPVRYCAFHDQEDHTAHRWADRTRARRKFWCPGV
jgi:hypothetical protein